jgi:hypothetical protein
MPSYVFSFDGNEAGNKSHEGGAIDKSIQMRQKIYRFIGDVFAGALHVKQYSHDYGNGYRHHSNDAAIESVL